MKTHESPSAKSNLAGCYWKIKTEKFQKRFFRKINKEGPIPNHVPELGKCWMWIAAKYFPPTPPYGWVKVCHARYGAHRISWIIKNGEIPNGLWILHKCDNPTCVNPDHLFLGSPKDNTQDMLKKGRDNGPKGERQHLAKLTAGKVIEIRKLISEGLTHQSISEKYGVSRRAITHIKNKACWAHVI